MGSRGGRFLRVRAFGPRSRSSPLADRIRGALSEDEIKTVTEIFQKVVARGGEGKRRYLFYRIVS
jgi:hypothetical protein